MKPDDRIALFSLDCGSDFASQVAVHLGVPLGKHEERDFEDGEHKIRTLETVRNRDVFVVQSLNSSDGLSTNDKLVRLLFLLASLRDAGAGRLNVVAPYLSYSRKDRRTKPNDPVTTRYVAQLFEAMTIDTIVTVDVHNRAAFENAFRCPTVHLSAREAFIDYLLPELGDREITVASPDIGGVKRAELFRESLANRLERPVGSAFMEKHRSQGEMSGSAVVGDIRNRTVLILDDLIAGGGTMQRAAEAFKDQGAEDVIAIATHAVFTQDTGEKLSSSALSRVILGNTVTPSLPSKSLKTKVELVDITAGIADTITALHEGRDVTDLES
ncbi:MAG: ribose-phosphate pyrophosphokinase [Marinobacter sp.]|jgi:ribose-phosphate pyrophosphokinase|nr:ribose-phosphate pyrophosphokinase [Marinobacter sp.]PHS47250.1 MAG: ribose-phosphate pyrophosphokinase [Marinobacter sp.]PTB94911.1 ribose-phosphate pyrophosphokinase [Marinobacter sp. B9-2]PTB99638.1 ribose-phosphate pyrophosphokinase [Marinobacter sp. Z-F4-2]|tara:strand:- start:8358 stop:9341 length:984 start_codon:yes stop_codon:yes gene_type:complete